VYVAVLFWHHFNSALRFDPPNCLARALRGSDALVAAARPPSPDVYVADLSSTSLQHIDHEQQLQQTLNQALHVETKIANTDHKESTKQYNSDS